jgi:hypothetical protein
MRRVLTIMALLLLLASAAEAQIGSPRVGVLAGGYWLTRSESKSLFGDVWPNVDLELFFRGNHGETPGGLSLDLSYRGGSDNGKATLIPLTFGWWEDISDWAQEESAPWKSYGVARVGPYYGKVSGVPGGETTVGLNAHLVLGVIFGRRFLAELRYDWYTKIADTNFEGLTFQIGFLLTK